MLLGADGQYKPEVCTPSPLPQGLRFHYSFRLLPLCAVMENIISEKNDSEQRRSLYPRAIYVAIALRVM
jgi:hypothetical protein